ncbi:MAG: hypothetical protein D3924_07870 [Candidatus Electrothrix sp. AR4]|nr:hypothetical protein [Candidatus Electrothrix sp. AR4]
MNFLFFRSFFSGLSKIFLSQWHSGNRYLFNIKALSVPLFFLLLPTVCQAISLTVDVQGVEDELHENIMASLKIVLQRENPELTARHIHKLHKGAPDQIAKALAPFGYYSVQTKESLTEDETGWHASYEVDKGPPVLIGTLNIEVTGSGKDKAFLQGLAETFPLQPEDQLKDSLYETGKKDILTQALRNGYVKARFAKSNVIVQQKERRADRQLCLESGP